MNGVRPALGIEFDDKYINAKSKVIECMKAINELTPTQRERLMDELMRLTGTKALFEQFMQYMNSRGRF